MTSTRGVRGRPRTEETIPAPVNIMDLERCDRCGQRALVAVAVIVTDDSGRARESSLSFCGHHFNKVELALLRPGVRVLADIRQELVDAERTRSHGAAHA